MRRLLARLCWLESKLGVRPGRRASRACRGVRHGRLGQRAVCGRVGSGYFASAVAERPPDRTIVSLSWKKEAPQPHSLLSRSLLTLSDETWVNLVLTITLLVYFSDSCAIEEVHPEICYFFPPTTAS